MTGMNEDWIAGQLHEVFEYFIRLSRDPHAVPAGGPEYEVRLASYYRLFLERYPAVTFPPHNGQVSHWVWYGHRNVPWLRPGIYCARALWFIEFLNAVTSELYQHSLNSDFSRLYCFFSIPEAVAHWRVHAAVRTDGQYDEDNLSLFELTEPPHRQAHWTRGSFLGVVLRETLLVFLLHLAVARIP